MTNVQRKALYLFLTSLLGIILFLMLHRSLFVIYDVMGSFFPGNPIFSADTRTVFTFDFISMLVAMFIGGWYGIWLGLDWYKMIYEEREGREWFHGFLPHNWRGYHARRQHKAVHKPEASPRQMNAQGPTALSRRIESFASFRAAPRDNAWSFDDVEAPSSVAKPKRKVATKKRVAKKRIAADK
jgi:hypothetical protein